jgi:hypothetical protein
VAEPGAGDVLERRTGELHVVHPDVGDHGDGGVGDVGGIPPPEESDFDHHDVHGDVREPAERRGRHDLEVPRLSADDHGDVRNRGDLLGEVLVGDGFEVTTDPFVHPFEVWARVGPHGEAAGDEQPRDHLGGRSLAVRPRDVHDRGGVLRIAERFAQRGDVRQRR